MRNAGGHLRHLLLAVAALVVSGLVGAPAAPGAVRLASPASADTTGDCVLSPCRLDRALARAQAGDEVALQDGVYAVSYQAKADHPVTIRPAAPGTRPLLVGDPSLATPTLWLAGGGTVKDLRIRTSAAVGLHLAAGALGVGLEVVADATDPDAVAVKLSSAPAGTALINSVARTQSTHTAVHVVDGVPAGGASLVNVTAIATGASSWGVTTELAGQSPVLKNSIVRATAKHLHGKSGTQPILVSSSNFGTTGAANWTDAGGNQPDVAVTFADEANGNLRPLAGSPTIDAGVADALTTNTTDPDGRARLLGAAPDIGAYEREPGGTGAGGDTGTPGDDPGPGTTTPPPTILPGLPGTGPAGDGGTVLPAATPPVLGETVTVGAAAGRALVRLPGSGRFVPLTDAASIPVGSTVDATRGRITLTSVRDARGRTQTGEFWGGRFVVRQAKVKGKAAPYTDLVLTGASFRGCPATRRRARAAAATAARRHEKRRRSVVRGLWGSDDRGRFRTRGRNSVATVRGTTWLVQDRCDGTLTRVREGAVLVRELGTRHSVLVRAGRSHLARRR